MYVLCKVVEMVVKICGVYGVFGYGYFFCLEDGGSSEKMRIL